jgi:hypothetical protein
VDGVQAYALTVSDDGRVYCAVFDRKPDSYIKSISPRGQILWSQKCGPLDNLIDVEINRATGNIVASWGSSVMQLDKDTGAVLSSFVGDFTAVTTDASGHIYGLGETSGVFIRKLGPTGDLVMEADYGAYPGGSDSYGSSVGIAIHPDGNIAILHNTSEWNGPVLFTQVLLASFSPSVGRFVRESPLRDGASDFECRDCDDIDFTLDNAGHIYLVEGFRRDPRVFIFDTDGQLRHEFGNRGHGTGQLSQYIEGVAVDTEGRIYIADWGNERIMRFSPESTATPFPSGPTPEPEFWIGISGKPIDAEVARALELPAIVTQGILIEAVEPGSPAADAGLVGGEGAYSSVWVGGEEYRTAGDVVTKVDGRLISTVEELEQYVSTLEVGDSITLTVIAEGRQMTVSLVPRPRL